MMIDARELRIGNYLFYRGEKEAKVSSIGSNGFETTYIGKDQPNGSTELDEYKPIPLTEEWLVRFGAKRDDLEIDSYVLSSLTCDYRFFKSTTIDGDIYWTCEKVLGDTSIEHVHELQNLYFALTGEELKLNDK